MVILMKFSGITSGLIAILLLNILAIVLWYSSPILSSSRVSSGITTSGSPNKMVIAVIQKEPPPAVIPPLTANPTLVPTRLPTLPPLPPLPPIPPSPPTTPADDAVAAYLARTSGTGLGLGQGGIRRARRQSIQSMASNNSPNSGSDEDSTNSINLLKSRLFVPIMQSPGYSQWENDFQRKYNQLSIDSSKVGGTSIQQSTSKSSIYQPTIDQPFFFFHIPKTGGTSLRDFLFREYFHVQRRPLEDIPIGTNTVVGVVNTTTESVVQSQTQPVESMTPDYDSIRSMSKGENKEYDGILAPCYNVDCAFVMTKPVPTTPMTPAVNITSCTRVFLGHFYPFEALSNLLRVAIGVVQPSPSPLLVSDNMTQQWETMSESEQMQSLLPRYIPKCSRWQSLLQDSSSKHSSNPSVASHMVPPVPLSIPLERQLSPSTAQSETGRLKQLLQSRDLTGQDPIFWQLLDRTRCITVLRNPFQRAISGYYEFGYPLTNLTLTEYLNRNSVRDFLWISSSYINAQTAILGGELDPDSVNRQTLLNAQKVLHQCIVGIQEDMPTFVNMVSMALSIPLSPPPGSSSLSSRLGHYNSLKDKTQAFGNSALQAERQTFNATHFRELVRPYLSLDYELWLYAKEIVIKRQKESLFKNELNKVKTDLIRGQRSRDM